MSRDDLRCDTSNAVLTPDLASLSGKAALIIKPISQNVLREVHSMREVLGEAAPEQEFNCLAQSAFTFLPRIGHQIMQGRIRPWVMVNHSPGDYRALPIHREVRLGVFPVAANPFHWAHLLGGLLAMEAFSLDKIIYVIAGNDPRKPDMAPAEARHAMARTLLGLFHPLFEYSPIAMMDSSAGEENLFRILRMNPRQHIHAFYIAGSDHYHRAQPMTGNPDTIERLEEGIARTGKGFDNHIHRVSVVFLEREPVAEVIPTSLDVLWLRGLPVRTSSSVIRLALSDREQRGKLCPLPFTAYMSICENRLYDTRSREETSLQTP